MQKVYTTVLTDNQRQSFLRYVSEGEYYAIDTETTGLNPRKCTMIGLSVCGEPGISFYIPTHRWNVETGNLDVIDNNIEYTAKVLGILKNKKLITFNGSFDLRVIESNYGIDLLDALYIDAMLMKHTIEEDGVFGLKPIAIQIKHHLNLDVEREANEEQLELKANIQKNGGSATKTNYEMYKADLDVLAKYAAADADLTLRVAQYYDNRLTEEGLDRFYYEEEVMPLYKKVTIPLEKKGVRLDIPLMRKSLEEIKTDIATLEKEINEELEGMPQFRAWLKDYLEEEVPPKKSGKFIQALCEYYNADVLLKNGKYSTAKNLVDKLEIEELKSFILTEDVYVLDPGIVTAIQKQILKEKNESQYLINISSKNQMADLVFNYIKMKPLSYTDKENKPQFDDAFLQQAEKSGVSWAKKIGNYNKLNKLKSTYIERYLEAQEDGYYYFNYKQHGTISGRYSSDAQQLPRPKEDGQLDELVLKYTNLIRSFFIADEGRIFIDCDYESLEPHVFADVANDDGLKDIFRKGHDFYSTIAIKTEKLQGVSADKKADNYLGKVNKPARQNAKAYSLGIPYGLGPYALGKTLDIPTEEAEKLVNGYLDGFPNLRKWMEDTKTFVTACGFIKSKAGRVRHLPKAKEMYEKYGDDLLDFKFRNSLIKRMKSRGISDAEKVVTGMYLDYKNSINNSYNYQIQSLSASIVNRAAIEINKEFLKRNINGQVVAQIHDQLIMEVPKDNSEECAQLVKHIMENTTKLSIDLKSPPSLSVNWKDGH